MLICTYGEEDLLNEVTSNMNEVIKYTNEVLNNLKNEVT